MSDDSSVDGIVPAAVKIQTNHNTVKQNVGRSSISYLVNQSSNLVIPTKRKPTNRLSGVFFKETNSSGGAI